MSELKLLKAIWEIRYKAAGMFFDNRGRIADRWYMRNGFENWNIARNNVRLTNQDMSMQLYVDHRRTAFDAEGWALDKFCPQAALVTAWTTKLLRIRKIERIGFRVQYIAERESFEKTYEAMINKLFALNDEDWLVFGGKPLDVGFPLTLAFGEHKANFRMGPMTIEEYENILQSPAVKSKLPEASFFIDFDMYHENPIFASSDFKKEYRNFMQNSGILMQRISNNILEHYGGFK